MQTNTISHRGISAWLQDDKKKRLALTSGLPTDGVISAVVSVTKQTNYTIEWRSETGKPVNACCDIFRKQKKLVRIGNHWMAADNPETQSRSSRGRLEVPQERDAFLRVRNPPSGGFVSLEIRRLREPPKEVEYRELNSVQYEMELDYLDDPDSGMPPFITFRFEFEATTSKEVSSHHSSTRTRTRASLPLIKKSSSDEEGDSTNCDSPSIPSIVDSPPLQIQNTQDMDTQEKRTREDEDDLDEVDRLLKKQKLLKQKRAQIEEKNERARVETKRLLKELREVVQAQEKLLAEVEREAEEIYNKNQEIKTAIAQSK